MVKTTYNISSVELLTDNYNVIKIFFLWLRNPGKIEIGFVNINQPIKNQHSMY